MLKGLALVALFLAGAHMPLQASGDLQREILNSRADASQKQGLILAISEVDKENADNAERYAYYKAHPKEYLKAALAPANFSNLVLAVLGFIAGLIGVFTLFALKKQVSAQMDADRAWITVSAIANPPQSIRYPGYTPGVVYQIEVTGNSPAKIIRERFRCRIVPSIEGSKPAQPLLEKTPTFASEEGMFYGEVIRPAGNKYDIPVSLESGPITDQQWSDLCDSKTILCAYGCIEYEDTFRRPRYMRVCCFYHLGLGGVLTSPGGIRLNPPGFRRGGPKGYNEYT